MWLYIHFFYKVFFFFVPIYNVFCVIEDDDDTEESMRDDSSKEQLGKKNVEAEERWESPCDFDYIEKAHAAASAQIAGSS